ncbi:MULTISPECIES: hypothetical protein [Halobacillus]|uniref:Uncharacterized protein n=1 Tax=Halobacillus faecis TaxID=360184 RepID=A0A511WNH9_9BACI|nr:MULTISPECIES: hypothetical protein [Halobacillus]MBX0356907.1 hypothetical protein [Halobacillus sp. Nhm2S1]GEN52696.1 hypothetical protein HFA01_09580 [Halobacillus faecis]
MTRSQQIFLGLALGFALVLGFQLGFTVSDQWIVIILIALGCGFITRFVLQWFFKRRNHG